MGLEHLRSFSARGLVRAIGRGGGRGGGGEKGGRRLSESMRTNSIKIPVRIKNNREQNVLYVYVQQLISTLCTASSY